MKIILLGAPGAGKGSQAALLTGYYQIPHISTGDAFRSNITRGTEIGIYAKSFIDQGLLVPDEVTIQIVKDRLTQDDCKNGFMLDGFPRTIAQAEALASFTEIDAVINIDVDFGAVIARLSGRRSCSCGAVYHVSTYADKTCAKCGKDLYVRDDDREDAIRKRLEVYEAQTAPLTAYYEKKDKLIHVDGNCTIQETFAEITSILKK